MVVEQREGSIAIITNGSGGYLVVDIIGEADTYKEAEEIMQEELEGGDDEEEEDEDEEPIEE